MELFNPNSNINFMGWRTISVAISVLLMLASLYLIFTRGLNYALDFTGGASIEISYEKPADDAEVRAALEEGGFHHAVVQNVGGAREFIVRVPPRAESESGAQSESPDAATATPAATTNASAAAEDSTDAGDRLAADVLTALQAKRPDAQMKKKPDFVGPQVGSELRNDGLIAVTFVALGIMLYIWLRFEWRFGVAAIASEVHDTLLTVGFLILAGREFDLTVLAAVLSVVGYSINDKVVVFDRVREIFRSATRLEPEQVLNKAVNNTLSRTIMTSVTTSLAVGALYLYGGPAVEGFGITMIAGIVIGTLSSIFFANPILLWLGVSKRDLLPRARDTSELARRP
jgi:preprotein translocase subunit SecF